MSISSWDENKVRILTLSSMAQTLMKNMESIKDIKDLPVILDQYSRIRHHACSIDSEADRLLLNPDSIRRLDDAKLAIGQLVNYTTAKAMPLFLELMRSLAGMGLLHVENPLAPLMPMLTELGLTTNWVIGVSALALIEVAVNQKLNELKLSKGGSFKEKFKRLSSKAGETRVKFPDLLTTPFHEARNKVVHEGKEPTPEELDIILRYLTTFYQALRRI